MEEIAAMGPLAVPAADVAEGRLTRIEVGGRPILLTRLNGRAVAFGAACPHAAGDLGAGQFHRNQIECPVHGYRFDVSSGRAVWPPDEMCRLSYYLVEEEAGIIRVWPRRLAPQSPTHPRAS